MRHPRFWSDDLDMDLPKVLPDLDAILGDTADTRLWVHGGETGGRLNHPAVWGVDAFYGLTPDATGKPDAYYTGAPVVECTWREAVRDAWPHTYRLHVAGRLVWDTHALSPIFNQLMYDRRGIQPMQGPHREHRLGHVRRTVERATDELRAIAGQAAGR